MRIVWPGDAGPGGLDERYVASVHSPKRSGAVSTRHTESGEAGVTAAGHTLTTTNESLNLPNPGLRPGYFPASGEVRTGFPTPWGRWPGGPDGEAQNHEARGVRPAG